MNKDTINCYKCKYFYITWNKDFPKGCKFFGFTTHKLPSTYVLESSGEACHGFSLKSKEK